MPKILARDPAWLSSKLFKAEEESRSRQIQDVVYDGPLRKIVHRGSEVIVAVGNELRWSGLGDLKVAGEEADRRYRGGNEQEEGEKTYKILKTPVARPITQLCLSPAGDYLAVLTSHTIHICVLPTYSSLQSEDNSPLRLRAFQLGPTAHVLEQSPLVCALWHPLAANGECLVTVTQDACIRLWELDTSSRSTFFEPTVAIDLKKLANATSNQADFSTSKYGTNKGFSPDDVEMVVAAACFGGQGLPDEHGWASMTLWVAMTEGDVYALCPLLPARWRATETMLPSLSTSVMEKVRATTRDADISEGEKRVVEQQRKWLADVDAQDPLLIPSHFEGWRETAEVYNRPTGLSAVPKLQGPFQLAPEPDFGEITDIHVIAPKVDSDALYAGDGEDDVDADEGLSVGIVCLATSTNEIHVCLDLEGVEAEWLPTKRSRAYALDEVEDARELLLFETIDLAQQGDDHEDNGFPTFTISPVDRYQLFVTHPTGVSGLDFGPWVGMLEDELSSPSDSGAGFRLDIVLDSTHTLVDQPIYIPTSSDSNNSSAINTAISLSSPALSGLFLLTLANQTPYSAILDILQPNQNPFEPDSPSAPLAAPSPRAPYRPPQDFDTLSSLPQLIKSATDSSRLGSGGLAAPLKVSPATVQLMTDAHRVLSNETHRLGIAAADLFRRCERMRAELREQVRKVAEVAARVDAVTGADEVEPPSENDERDADDEERDPLNGAERIELRILTAQDKTRQLNSRADAIRKKMSRLAGQGLSERERAWEKEVARVEGSLFAPHPTSRDGSDVVANGDRDEEGKGSTLAGRVEAVTQMQARLVREADEASSATEARGQGGSGDARGGDGGGAGTGTGVGGEYRRQKLQQVMALLERESALVEGVQERLRRLERG
ncbi:uncharacterized protein LTR77_005231 [Saxophila tyrrhenica]|uniref:Uncharacterized protein n=1 Tax=Saxophila tyrrhenica TaxID=1690608 RepID=A0AAV9PEG5_9PEZI|nr:hypothetical protein LTR77_005231 [Saxophila tyrrhenica]